jgi:high affinity Mn2+ porin
LKYFNRNSIRSLRWVRGVVRSSYAVFLLLCVLSALTAAQTADENSQPPDGGEAAPDSIFAHSNTSRYWISGQDNIIFQQHPGFRSLYSGTNSLRSQSERAISNVATLYTGLAITHSTEVFVDLESASGGGLSDALGLAGFTNVDVVRNPELGSKPYLARAMIRQIIALGRDTEESDRGTFALATRLPVRRLELRAGKFGMADFFDNNAVGSDSHLQFMNWTADNNGAYDYAADTRGYTIGVIAEYHDRGWAFRFGEALMPKVANGIDLEWNLSRARAENLELEVNPKIFSGHKTTLRLLSFVNHANMGVYREAIHD